MFINFIDRSHSQTPMVLSPVNFKIFRMKCPQSFNGIDNSEFSKIVYRASKLLRQMKSAFWTRTAKFCAYLLFKIFRQLIDRILVMPKQLHAIRELQERNPKIPIIYLPLHRSKLDCLLITWTLWNFGIRLPHIAARDNLCFTGCK